jgi:hypothetical protein
MTPTVYLCGPITGLSYNDCTDWREGAVKDLAEHGIRGLSPMRGKDYLRHLETISGTGEEYAHLGVLSTPRAVLTRDRWDSTRCSMLLANLLGAKAVSIGSVMEIAWADLARIPIICAIEETGNPHEHMMLKEAIGFRVPTLAEALHVAKAALS